MKRILMTAGVCALALGLRAQSTNYSTNASFRTSAQPVVTLPQFDAAGIGGDLGQIIQLTSVTLSLTGNVAGTLAATNTAVGTKTVNTLYIEVSTFRAATTNVPGIGVDLVARNTESFFSPDVANPDFTLAPGISSNFPDCTAPSPYYLDNHPAAILSPIRSAYTGAGEIEILLASEVWCIMGAQEGTRLGLYDSLASMTATITYTWEVIPEPGLWAGLVAAAAVVVAGRQRGRRGGRC